MAQAIDYVDTSSDSIIADLSDHAQPQQSPLHHDPKDGEADVALEQKQEREEQDNVWTFEPGTIIVLTVITQSQILEQQPLSRRPTLEDSRPPTASLMRGSAVLGPRSATQPSCANIDAPVEIKPEPNEPQRLKKDQTSLLRSQLKDLVREHEKAIEQFTVQLKEARRELSTANSRVEQSLHLRMKADRDAEASRVRADELQLRLAQLNPSVEAHIQKTQYWQEQHKKAHNECVVYKQNFDNVRKQLRYVQEEQASKICTVQMTAFKRFDDPAWVPQSHAQIAQRLKDIDFNIKTWCKNGILKSLKDIRNDEDSKGKLFTSLKSVVTFEDGKLPPALGDDKAWVVLQAALVDKIYFDIFDQPFFFLGEWLAKTKRGEDKDSRVYSIAHELGLLYGYLEDRKTGVAINSRTAADVTQ